MNCRKVKKNLVLFLDGELAAPEADAVRRHVEDCEVCRKEAELLRSTLDAALHRARQKPPPSPPENFCSAFWEREREERGEREAAAVKRRVSWVGELSPVKYAVGSVVAVAIVGVVLLALLQTDKQPSPGGAGCSATKATKEQGASPADDRLALIERRLEELEGAVRRLRPLANGNVPFTGEEMQEVYAAIGLAAANSYRDVLKMNGMAAERYARVASFFPETSAGREAEKILSGLN